MTLLEEVYFGHVDGDPKSEEVVALIHRLMFTLYEAVLRFCLINMPPCFMKDLSLSVRDEWMCSAAQF
jgi:hypothetical protein